MKIVVTGTRGIPDIQGGVETHCQELYPRLAAMGHDVTVICRSPYVTCDSDSYKGVNLISVAAPRSKSIEAIVHTWRALLAARRLKPDILHIHAIGPALLTPIARLMGMKVVTTNHGPDYERGKWGWLAKTVLRLGEYLGVKFSNKVIAISNAIATGLTHRYGCEPPALIYNGVNHPVKSEKTDYVESLGLEKGKYVVALGRLVPEKGFHDLMDAWRSSPVDGYKLVIAGDSDHPDEYSSNLKDSAKANGVVLTGFIKGERLNQLMTNAALFVMPSYHEGLPIALLEALSYGLDVAVSDIPACQLKCLETTDHFEVGNIKALSELMISKLSNPAKREYDLTIYNWDEIAQQTERLYLSVI